MFILGQIIHLRGQNNTNASQNFPVGFVDEAAEHQLLKVNVCERHHGKVQSNSLGNKLEQKHEVWRKILGIRQSERKITHMVSTRFLHVTFDGFKLAEAQLDVREFAAENFVECLLLFIRLQIVSDHGTLAEKTGKIAQHYFRSWREDHYSTEILTITNRQSVNQTTGYSIKYWSH